MRFRSSFSVLLLLSLVPPATRAGNAYVPLVVTEHVGVSRRSSPVTSGVPLPRGRVHRLSDLRILDASGTPVPAQFRALSTWSDGSLRWVLSDFQADVAAAGSADFALTQDPLSPSPLPGEPVFASRASDTWTIDTGAAVFTLGAVGGELLQRVTIAGEVVSSEPGRIDLVSGGELFRGVFDPAQPLELEESGPLRVVLRGEGAFQGAAGPHVLTYTLRLHFFAGSSAVRVFMTLRNNQAAGHPGNYWDLGSAGSVSVDDLTLSLPLQQEGPLSWFATGESDTTTAGLGSELISLYQESSGGDRWNLETHVNAAGVVPLTFRGYQLRSDGAMMAEGNRAVGLLGVSSSSAGLAVGVRHFWQNFPKALRAIATPGGARVDVSLFPAEFPEAVEIQGGEEKTHEVHVVFHAADAQTAAAEDRLASMASPLRARPSWEAVSRSQAVVGHFGPKDLEAFPDWENTVEYIALDKGVRSFFTQREQIDEYGWRNFGESFADHETRCVTTQCWDCPISHDQNQYDPNWTSLLFWLRNGEPEWFDLGEQGSRHVSDIDVYHTQFDTPAYNGGMFWHTTHDTDAYTSTHRTYSIRMESEGCTPYTSGGPGTGHIYAEGLMLYGYLTGDPRAFEVHSELAAYARTRYEIDDPSPGSGYAARAAANTLRTVVAEYRRTGDAAMLEIAMRIVVDNDPNSDIRFDGTNFGMSMMMKAIGRFLDLKAERGEEDADAAIARGALTEYARRVIANYPPRFDVLDFRYSDAMHYAYKHAEQGDPDKQNFLQAARAFFAAGEQQGWFNTYINQKNLAHVAGNGHLHTYMERGRIPADVQELRLAKQGEDVSLSWAEVDRDAHGNAWPVSEYSVFRSSETPTRFDATSLLRSGGLGAVAAGDVSDGVALHCYEVRAIASPGIEGL